MDKEAIARLVRGEIEKIKYIDRHRSTSDSTISDNRLPHALLLSDSVSEIDSKLKDSLRSANFNPVTDLLFADDAKMLVLTDLSHRNLSYICDGIDEGEYASAVVNGILRGKEVILIEEGLRYKGYLKSSNKAFYEMMNKKERLLSSYGVRIMKEKSFINYLEKTFSSRTASEEDVFNGRLITEEHARCLSESGVFEIDIKRGVIITPLAQDYIREHNMSVRYRGH
jgi:ethanolamine utilization protein